MSRLEFVDREHLGVFIKYLKDKNLMYSSINGYLRLQRHIHHKEVSCLFYQGLITIALGFIA